MLRYAMAYVGTGGVFLGADFIWLNRAMSFYRSSLGGLLAEKPNLAATAALYLIHVVGIVIFAVLPVARNGGWIACPNAGPPGRIREPRPHQSCHAKSMASPAHLRRHGLGDVRHGSRGLGGL